MANSLEKESDRIDRGHAIDRFARFVAPGRRRRHRCHVLPLTPLRMADRGQKAWLLGE